MTDHVFTTFERRQSILRLLQEQSGVHVGDLAKRFDVSEGTVRNDLTALEEEQLIVRVRGGAILRDSQPPAAPLLSRARVNFDSKQRIARWAADMVEDGSAILLDASTTVLSIVPFLAERRNLTIVTNGLEAARALAQNPNHTVIVVGGILLPDGNALAGTLSEPILKDLYIQTAFVSCVGLTAENGLTETDFQQAQLKSLLVRLARQVVALVDSTKFGKVALAPFMRMPDLTHLVTDDGISADMTEQVRRANVALTICGEEAVNAYRPRDVDARSITIGFANLSEDLSFAVDVRRGLERAAQAAGNIDLVLADNQLNGETALHVADHLIERGVELAIEFQIDEKMGNPIINKFHRAGIPVIAVDIPMVGATFFGVDNYRAGHMAGVALGEWVRDHWGGTAEGVIALEEPRSGALTAARIQGQLDGLREIIGGKAMPPVTYLDSGNIREVSESHFLEALARFSPGQRLAVISFNDDAAMGALAAARRADREQDVVIVGMGADRRTRAEMRKPDSRIIGSTAFTPERYGDLLIDLALKLLRGEPVPPAVYVEHIFITPHNLAIYYPE